MCKIKKVSEKKEKAKRLTKRLNKKFDVVKGRFVNLATTRLGLYVYDSHKIGLIGSVR
jgi:hypothetical protein